MLAFFDWQLKELLFEEKWAFSSSSRPAQLLEIIERDLSSHDHQGHSRAFPVKVSISTFNISVASNRKIIWTVILGNNYYFLGNLDETKGQSKISGEYRSNTWRRIIFLFGLNFIIVYFIGLFIGLISILYEYGGFLFSPEGIPAMHEILFLVIGSFGFLAIFYLFARLVTYIEKYGRKDIFQYLEWISTSKENAMKVSTR